MVFATLAGLLLRVYLLFLFFFSGLLVVRLSLVALLAPLLAFIGCDPCRLGRRLARWLEHGILSRTLLRLDKVDYSVNRHAVYLFGGKDDSPGFLRFDAC